MGEKGRKYYQNGREHLMDELLKLDTLVHLQVVRFRDLYARNQTRDEGLAGLCIKDEDVDREIGKKPKSRGESHVTALIKQVDSLREKISEKVENSLKQVIYLPLYHLAGIFQLTPFELDIVLICLAPELDIKYEKLYAYLQDDVT
ncbi:MAG: hypothetical protein JSV88_12875, partial [Candidatus Aminicenantes bacterium]